MKTSGVGGSKELTVMYDEYIRTYVIFTKTE